MTGTWIPVKFALPAADEEVLVAINLHGNRCISLATWDDREEKAKRWIGTEALEPFAGTVTHWMKLPALPEVRRQRRTR